MMANVNKPFLILVYIVYLIVYSHFPNFLLKKLC